MKIFTESDFETKDDHRLSKSMCSYIANEKIQPLLEQVEKLREALGFIKIEPAARSYSYYGPQVANLYYVARDLNTYMTNLKGDV